MLIDSIKDFLDEHGISYRMQGSSLVLKDCPACGESDWKVHFSLVDKKNPDSEAKQLYGRCFHGRCQTNYSTISYLIRVGIDRPAVLGLHGLNPDRNFRQLIPGIADIREERKEEQEEQPSPDISLFVPIDCWSDHPASVYAHKRGVTADLYRHIMINPEANSVVFLVWDGPKLVGYQERYVSPKNPKMKTKTSPGFKKTSNILVFDNPGKKILVCEGPFTAVAAWRYGYTGVCTFGSDLGQRQAEKIIGLAKERGVGIGVAVDDDAAGNKYFASVRNSAFWEGIEVFVVKPVVTDNTKKINDLNDAWMAGLQITEESAGLGTPAIPSIPTML